MGLKQKIALKILVISGAPFFFFGGPGYYAGRIFQSAWNLGHLLFFALFSWIISSLFFSRNGETKLTWLFSQVFFLVLIVGIFIEIVQMTLTGRSPDLYDLLRNQAGCLLSFAFLGPRKFRCGIFLKFLFQSGVVILLTAAIWPFIWSVADELVARRQFPVLSDFETPFEESRWLDNRQLSLERAIVRSGKRSMKVKLSTANYSGTSLVYFPANWQGYKNLHFSIYYPLQAELFLHCRIQDEQHKYNGSIFIDRYHRRFKLNNGWNDLTVSLAEVKTAPFEREMEMDKIERLGLFVISQAQSQIIYIDDVYLEK